MTKTIEITFSSEEEYLNKLEELRQEAIENINKKAKKELLDAIKAIEENENIIRSLVPLFNFHNPNCFIVSLNDLSTELSCMRSIVEHEHTKRK